MWKDDREESDDQGFCRQFFQVAVERPTERKRYSRVRGKPSFALQGRQG